MNAFARALGAALVGAMFIVFNFSGLLGYAGHHWTSIPQLTNALVWLSRLPVQTFHASDLTLFQSLVRLCVLGVFAFPIGAALLALTQRNVLVLTHGLGGLIAGMVIVTILAWVGFVAVVVLLWIGPIVLVILRALAWFFTHVVPFVIAVAVVAYVVWFVYGLVRQLGWRSTGLLGLGLAIAVVVGIVLHPFLARLLQLMQQFLRWLASVLAGILAFIALLFGWLVYAAMVVVIVSAIIGVVISLGQLLVDQFRSAWYCGRGHRSILVGSFSIGLGVWLLLWQSSGSPALAITVDHAWHTSAFLATAFTPANVFFATLPKPLQAQTLALFGTSQAATFDALTLAAVTLVGMLGMLRGLFRNGQHADVEVRFVNELGLALIALPLVVLAAIAPKDSS